MEALCWSAKPRCPGLATNWKEKDGFHLKVYFQSYFLLSSVNICRPFVGFRGCDGIIENSVFYTRKRTEPRLSAFKILMNNSFLQFVRDIGMLQVLSGFCIL